MILNLTTDLPLYILTSQRLSLLPRKSKKKKNGDNIKQWNYRENVLNWVFQFKMMHTARKGINTKDKYID